MKITSLTPDPKNANKGTKRGRKALARSLKRYGAGRSILVDKNGQVIAGNKTLQQAIAAGHKEVVVVESDGSKLVVVKRTDLDSKDEKSKALAIADNRVSELDLDWDADVLKELGEEIDLDSFFTDDEIDKLMGESTNGNGKGRDMDMELTYSVIVDCDSEEKQLELLKRLETEKYSCRLLIS